MRPTLSVIASSRNDNHGGDMTRRMQLFVNSWIAQAKRHRLHSELILVEWNPPSERAPLSEELNWPDDEGFCPVRIVTVPKELHKTLDHHDKLPLFQMVAKNVGIRRARGKFILATNVDLVFSDPLMRFLSSEDVKEGVLYRSDRADVDSDFPFDSSIEEQLDFCDTHVTQVSRKDRVHFVNRNSGPRTIYNLVVPELTLMKRISRSLKGVRKSALGSLLVKTYLWQAVGLAVGLTLEVLTAGTAFGKTEAGRLQRMFLEFRMVIRGKKRVLFRDLLNVLTFQFRKIPFLHTNACGDFTLMSKKDWDHMAGYLEWPMYSFHIDSLGVHLAHALGVAVKDLPREQVHFHLEHGGGWTPNGDLQLYDSMIRKNLPILFNSEYVDIVKKIYANPEMFRNKFEWGFGNETLPEVEISQVGEAPGLKASPASSPLLDRRIEREI